MASTYVPVQASAALKQEIDGSDFANHVIEVHIEALLDDLGGDKNKLVWTIRCVFPKFGQHLICDPFAVLGRETRVEQQFLVIGMFQLFVDGLRLSDRVQDHATTAAVLNKVGGQGRGILCLAE